MNTLGLILASNIIISLISFVGIATLLRKSLLTQKNIHILVSFAAGVMLTTAFFDVLPEAFSNLQINSGLKWVFCSIIVSFLIEKFIWHHHHHNDTHGAHPTTILILLGDGIHNFVDGLTIAASFLVSPSLGFATTLAIIAHEIPQELADFTILVNSGIHRNKALFLNFLSALSAVAGGLIGYYFLKQTELFTHAILAAAGGIFIYIATADLIPELHKDQNHSTISEQIIPFIVGIVLILVLA